MTCAQPFIQRDLKEGFVGKLYVTLFLNFIGLEKNKNIMKK